MIPYIQRQKEKHRAIARGKKAGREMFKKHKLDQHNKSKFWVYGWERMLLKYQNDMEGSSPSPRLLKFMQRYVTAAQRFAKWKA